MFLNFVTCLQSGKNRPSRSHKTIIIDNYEVTIFPAESVNHSHTIPAQSAMPSQKCDPEMKLGAEPYSTWFYDLQGKIYISNLQGVTMNLFVCFVLDINLGLEITSDLVILTCMLLSGCSSTWCFKTKGSLGYKNISNSCLGPFYLKNTISMKP